MRNLAAIGIVSQTSVAIRIPIHLGLITDRLSKVSDPGTKYDNDLIVSTGSTRCARVWTNQTLKNHLLIHRIEFTACLC